MKPFTVVLTAELVVVIAIIVFAALILNGGLMIGASFQ